jgi:hypothetical protein
MFGQQSFCIERQAARGAPAGGEAHLLRQGRIDDLGVEGAARIEWEALAGRLEELLLFLRPPIQDSSKKALSATSSSRAMPVFSPEVTRVPTGASPPIYGPSRLP